MIIPYLFLAIQSRVRLEESLVGVDGYEYPTGQEEESSMRMEDCIDDADGTLEF
jgi:hypothetical protein